MHAARVLAGSRPYPKDSELAIISAHLKDPPPRPTEVRPELPPAIDAVVAKGMAKAPDDRYETCAELSAAAREALEVKGTEPVPTGAPREGPGLSSSRLAATVVSRAGDSPRTVAESRGPRRRRRAPIAAGVVLIAAAIAVAIGLVATGGNPAHQAPLVVTTKRAAATTHSGAAAPVAHVVGSPIAVGSQPTGIDGGTIDGSTSLLWVANFGASTVTRVTPDGKIRTDIQLAAAPFAVLKIGSTFWVSSAGAGEVIPISVATGQPGKPVHVGAKPEWMTGDENALYVSNAASDTVSVINPRNGTLIGAPIKVGRVPRGITFSGSAVWVVDSADDKVARIVDGQVIKEIRVGRGAIGAAFGDNAVWVANKKDNTVSRIDLAQDTLKTIRVGRGPFAIAFGLGSAWVTNSVDNTVTRLEGTTGDVVGAPIAVGQDPTGIAVIGQDVWVTNRGSGTVQEIAP